MSAGLLVILIGVVRGIWSLLPVRGARVWLLQPEPAVRVLDRREDLDVLAALTAQGLEHGEVAGGVVGAAHDEWRDAIRQRRYWGWRRGERRTP